MAGTHHAYIYYGSLSQLAALVLDARERFGFERHPSTSLGAGNPDVQVREYEKFGIEEARDLTKTGTLKSISGRALYIVGISQINSEAQQALLKLFEEPQQGAVFVLLAPHGSIIATLRSRLMEYPESLQKNTSQKVLGSPVSRKSALGPDHFGQHFSSAFLASSPKARSTEIAALLKDEEGARERVRDFLDALEQPLYTALQKTRGEKNIREGLEDIAKVRSYTNDRSPSLKMLLEHLALSLPVIK